MTPKMLFRTKLGAAFVIVLLILAVWGALALVREVNLASRAAHESRAANLIVELEAACKLYERDYGKFPPMEADGFGSGPCVHALSLPGPRGQPYMEFLEGDVVAWPITPASHLRNPVDYAGIIHYRDNTVVATADGGPPVHNKYAVDIWCSDHRDVPTGVNNWRGRE